PSASPPSTQSCAGECWHAADASRVRVTDNGQRIDMVWKASIRDSIARKDLNGQELVTATKGSFASRYLHRGDAWVRGLLVVDVPEIGCSVPFEELRAQAAKVERVERLRADGREVVAVRLLFDPTHERQRKWEVEVHFDPSVNYLVRKVIHSRVGARSGFRRFEEVVQFKDCGGGVFFPERIIDRAETSNSSAANTKETVISHIQVNQPVPPSTFQLQY